MFRKFLLAYFLLILLSLGTEFKLNHYQSKKLLQSVSPQIDQESRNFDESTVPSNNTQSSSEGEIVSDKELNFIVLGDFGYTKLDEVSPQQKRVGDLVLKRVKQGGHHDFVISVGDNVYPYGLSSRKDKKAKILFEDTFQMTKLGLNWYPILGIAFLSSLFTNLFIGNHDMIGNLPASLNLTHKFPFWKQTEPYYSKYYLPFITISFRL